jgi:signal peptidase II
MLISSRVRTFLILLIVFVNIGCDQLSKTVVRENIAYHKPIQLMHENFILMKVENRGAFLGLGENLPPLAKNIGLNMLPCLAMLMILIYTLTKPGLSRGILISMACIMGGGVGNIIDRIRYGSVTDFLHIDMGGIFKTGIFNLADVSIVVGMGLFLLNYRKLRG